MILAYFPFDGFLAAVVDSQFSMPFQIAGMLHLVLFLLGISKNIRDHFWYKALVGGALLILPGLLVVGVYFAMLPVA